MKKTEDYNLFKILTLTLALGSIGSLSAEAQTLSSVYYNDGQTHEYYDNTEVDGVSSNNGHIASVLSMYGSKLNFKGDLNIDLNKANLLDNNTQSAVNALGGGITVDGNLNINVDTQNMTRATVYGALAAGQPLTVNGEFNVKMTAGKNAAVSAGAGGLILNGNSNVYIYAPSGTRYAYGYSYHYDRRIFPEALQLNAGQHNITVDAENGTFLGGIVMDVTTFDAKLGAGSTTNIRINSTNDGSVSWYNNGIKGVEGRINMAAGSKLNIFFDLPTQDTFDNNLAYAHSEYRSNQGLVGLYLWNGSNMEKDADIYMELSGAPIWNANDIHGNKFGLGSVAGIATYEAVKINSNVDINIISEQGVGIRIEDASGKTGKLDLNGTTIIRTNNGYALMSESIGFGDVNRDFAVGQIITKYSEININSGGGNLVQMVGDLDHRTLRKSYFNINLDREDSFLYGASLKSNVTADMADGLTDITLANGAQWYLTADSIVNNLTFNNNGLLDMHPTGHGKYETLTTTRLLGDNGNIIFSTDLQQTLNNNNVGIASDRLIITTQSAGTHKVDVLDNSLITQVKAHGYALLVEDKSQGDAKFIGGDLHKGGIFKYQPIITNIDPSGYDGIPTGSTNWYLTGFERQDDYTEGGDINTGLLEGRYVAYLNEQDTLIKRLGELRQHDKEQGLWVRIRGGKNTVDSSALNTNSYLSTYIGYDHKLEDEGPTKRYIGLALNHTANKFNYIDSASGKGYSNVLTLYGTRLGDKGHYLDLVGKIGRMSNDYQYGTTSGKAANWFYSMSAEYGRAITRANGWYYEPQIQFTYGRINGTSYTDNTGITVNADSVNSAILRAGILFGRKFSQGEQKEKNAYAKLFWSHEFAGHVGANMYDTYGDRTTFGHSYSGSWLTAGVGASMNLDKKTNLYLDVEKSFGGKVNSGWAWQAGLRWRW